MQGLRGASGAIYGMFVVAVLLKLEASVGKMLEVLILGQYMITQVLSEVQAQFLGKDPGVSHLGHLGGATAGALMIFLLMRAVRCDATFACPYLEITSSPTATATASASDSHRRSACATGRPRGTRPSPHRRPGRRAGRGRQRSTRAWEVALVLYCSKRKAQLVSKGRAPPLKADTNLPNAGCFRARGWPDAEARAVSSLGGRLSRGIEPRAGPLGRAKGSVYQAS